ncbi:MAG TPA: porin [Candidatus Duodenibacillus intestinavium]|nr:porin [Candidatus Duodenibacillus intestinavium]
MKKTLAAVAVLGAFAGSALAADVQIYGIVDTGLQYVHGDTDSTAANSDFDSFSMESGMASGSRFGFKGTEDLGNGLTVGFILEDGIKSDTGVDDDVLFNRESSLFLQGGFGKVAFGRIGSFNGGVSSWAKYGVMSVFGTSWGDYSAQAGTWAMGAGMWNNMIAYETPSFAGFKVFAQYGMGNQLKDANDKLVGDENESTSDRYYAVGASYNNGPLSLYFAVDSINYASAGDGKDIDPNGDDSLTVTFGGNYDFEVVKLYAGAQYFDEIKTSKMKGIIQDVDTFNSGAAKFATRMKGWSLGVSAGIPAAGGTIMVGAAYLDAEAADSQEAGLNKNDELSRWIVSAGYDYPFSKRTDVYGVVTYNQDSLKYTGDYPDQDPYMFGVMVGLRHRF